MTGCKAKTKSGEPCQMRTAAGSRYCFTHDPARIADRATARSKGGRMQSTPHAADPETINKQPRTIQETFTILDYALTETVAMENGIARNRLLVSIAAQYVDAHKVGELETQLRELLRVLELRKDK